MPPKRREARLAELNDEEKHELEVLYKLEEKGHLRVTPRILVGLEADKLGTNKYNEPRRDGEDFETDINRYKRFYENRVAKVKDALYSLHRLGLTTYSPEKRFDFYWLSPKGKDLARELVNSQTKNSITTKVTSTIFLIAGLFFMAIPDFTTTGNVIGNSAGADISFFLSFALMIIGGALLFKSLRK